MPRPYRFVDQRGSLNSKLSTLNFIYTKKGEAVLLSLLLGGDYLLSHFRSTIGVVRLNFSVRNGKRWNPHAVITFVLLFSASLLRL